MASPKETVTSKEIDGLDDEKSLLAAIVNSSLDSIVSINLARVITSWNKSAERLYGYKADEAIGKKLDMVIIPEDIRELITNIEKIIHTLEVPVYDTVRIKKGGQHINLDILLSPLKNTYGDIIGISTIARDIDLRKFKEGQKESARLKLYEEVQAQTAQNEKLKKSVKTTSRTLAKAQQIIHERSTELKNANENLQSFRYISNHDLQEPIRKIQVYCSLIGERDNNLSKKDKTYLKKIQSAAKREQMLLQDLVKYSNINRNSNVKEAVSFKLILDRVQADFSSVIKEKKATIEYGALCDLKMTDSELYTIISNIIGNSLKFSDSSRAPIIRITCRTAQGSSYRCERLVQNINYARISVIDNGIGFDNQYADKIFEPFERLHGSDSFTGTGIGLAICKRIVEYHNGIIAAKGKVNSGTRIDIYMPN